MFEAAELGHTVDKATYDAEIESLRTDLINAQFDLGQADFSVVLLIDGDDQPAAQQVFNALNVWMDGRLIDSVAFGQPTDEELARPHLWRYWRKLPARGRMGAFLGSWSLASISQRLRGEIDEDELARRVAHVKDLEQALVADGTLVVKFWMHASRDEIRRRAKRVRKDPGLAWRHGEYVVELYERYDEAIPVAERVVQATSTGDAPWHVIGSDDTRYAELQVARILARTLTQRLARVAAPLPDPAPPPVESQRTLLDTVDLEQQLDKSDYRELLSHWQGRLARRFQKIRDKGRSTAVVFEGWDAAGKGGAIRRITQVIRAQDVRVLPVAAPSSEELARHYLWRFWRDLPAAGDMVIFDRSWYGRVLVERVEGFAREDEWRRAYAEIRDFEAQLAKHGMLVLKFWLHIDPDEQLARFRARETTPYKKNKITEEDYRNRERWSDYEQAVNEMVTRTNTPQAPWYLVPSNDKRFARVEVIRTIAKALKRLG